MREDSVSAGRLGQASLTCMTRAVMSHAHLAGMSLMHIHWAGTSVADLLVYKAMTVAVKWILGVKWRVALSSGNCSI